MSSKRIATRQEDKTAAVDYLRKAGDNYKAMLLALENKNYNAAGTLAVQCVISASDAICIYEKGFRSISQDHFDVCDLVKSIPLPEAPKRSDLLKRIVAKKNLIQYERRSIYQAEAEEIVKITDRFYQWVVSLLDKK